MSGRKIREGLEDAVAFEKGDRGRGIETTVAIPRNIDVRAIRHKLELSQAEFALRFGLSLANVKNWEQGHRQPDGTDRVLLTLIDRIPEEISNALSKTA